MQQSSTPASRFLIPTFFAFISLIPNAFAQLSNYGNIWYFGNRAGLDFSSGAPQKLTNIEMDSYEGCAVYCDKNGQMLLYTNGGGFGPNGINGPREGIIWNRNQQVMYNMGATEGGGYSAAQSSLILPKPGSDNNFLVFTMDHAPSLDVPGANRGLSYFEVDMTLNGGLGGVVQANVPVFKPAVESLTAIPDAGNSGFWVITIDNDSRDFVVVPVTASGIGAPVLRPRNSNSDNVLVIKASPDGKFLFADGELYSFNRETGELNFLAALQASNYTLSFSPRSRYLYAFKSDASVDIIRYDLTAPDIAASEQTITSEFVFSFPGLMQIGPDYNLYFIEQLEDDFLEPIPPVSLSVIRCPDGVLPVLERSIMKFETDIDNAGGLFTSLPNFADYIFARQTASLVQQLAICDSTGVVLSPVQAGLTYSWSTGESTPTVTVKTAGTYTLTLEDSCDFYTYIFEVENGEIGTVAIEAPAVTDTCTALPLTLRAVAPPGSSLLWSDGSTADTLRIEKFGEYLLKVTNPCGTVTVAYNMPEPVGSCCRPFTPNAFTPNSDEVNDFFSPVLRGCDVEFLEFSVYSRWGELMFQNALATDRWDGTTLNGTEAPSDVYAYITRYKIVGEAEEKFEKGNVTLLR